ncbi:hypothetical protein [Enterococcus faecalis]|uniref:hypothetical protein n=1 Tax=Enterococcus faecalis TaxID=1351 RepID=UPI002936472A|nr:hypothetical protein [Enterococcus faecalis]MDV2932576.1 hypothetical protein [Enterococcus faecalis]
MNGNKKNARTFPFADIELLDVYKKEHISSLSSNPTNFLLLFSGDNFDTITEGIGMLNSDNKESDDTLVKGSDKINFHFGGVLTVDRYKYIDNNLDNLIKANDNSGKFSKVVAQYIIGGLENNQAIDYYFYWLFN